MKLTTFIKAYKIALFNISEKVIDWKGVYVGGVTFPEDNELKLNFTFTSGYNMQTGDIAISASLNIAHVEMLKGGLSTIAQMTTDSLDKDTMAKEYIKQGEKINEAGRMLVLLETLLSRLRTMKPDAWEDSIISSVVFNFDNDTAEFCIDGSRIYTNGCLLMFGD